MKKRTLDMDLLEAFVSVVETSSFTLAAGRLHLTQSAVSAKIKKLEAQVQHVLLERSSPVRPTPVGMQLLGMARRLIEAHELALEELTRTEVRGRIVVGTSETYAASILAPVLKLFRQSDPDVEIVIRCADSWDLLQAHESGEIDIVVTTPGPYRAGLTLRQERIVWACARDPSVARAERLRLALFPEGCVYRSVALDALSRAGRAWEIAYTCSHYDALLAAVEEDHVLTAITIGAVPQRFHILDDDGLPELPTVAIELYQSPGLSAAARRLVAEIERSCTRPPALRRAEPLGVA